MRTSNDIDKNIKYWIKSSEQDFQAAHQLAKSRHYPQCLFFCHLSIEKFLKAIVVKTTKDFPPYTHDLRKLAEIAKLDLTLERELILDKISTFNIVGRYADAKFKFYQKYNKKEYTQKYLKITQDLLSWIQKEFQKKQ